MLLVHLFVCFARVCFCPFPRPRHPAGDVTRVSMMLRKVTVKIGDVENRCRLCRDKKQ